MSKIMISYQTIEEREKIIKALLTGTKIKRISKAYDNGKYRRIYIDIEQVGDHKGRSLIKGSTLS